MARCEYSVLVQSVGVHFRCYNIISNWNQSDERDNKEKNGSKWTSRQSKFNYFRRILDFHVECLPLSSI